MRALEALVWVWEAAEVIAALAIVAALAARVMGCV